VKEPCPSDYDRCQERGADEKAESARPDIFLSFLLTERKTSDIFVMKRDKYITKTGGLQ
jgi:hypothetical protein